MLFSYAKIPYSKEIVTILIGGPLEMEPLELMILLS